MEKGNKGSKESNRAMGTKGATEQKSKRRKIFLSPFSLFFLCSLFSLLVGCKTSQKVGTIEAGEAKSRSDFFDSMQRQAFKYDSFSARTNVELDVDGKSLSSRVDIKIVRDSALLLTVQPFLGIEIFRATFDTKGIVIIDRMNKRYVSETYDDMKGKLPITFNYYNLQALFTNHLFIPGMQQISDKQYSRFKLKQEGSAAEIQIKDAMNLLYTFMADGEEKLLSTHVTDKSGKYALQWLYTDFRLTEGQPFPMAMNILLTGEEGAMGGMKVYFSRIQTNVPVNIDTTIPDKYKRITFAQLIKGLTGSNK